MSRAALLIFLLQALLAGCAICMGVWAQMPWAGVVGLALLAVSLMVRQAASLAERHRISRFSLLAAWFFALVAPCSFLLARDRTQTLDSYYAIFAWVVAASILLANHRATETSLTKQCLLLAMIWLLFGNCFLIAYSYSANLSKAFHVGLALMAIWLIAWKVSFRPPFLGVQVLNTLLLVCIGLPAADLLVRPSYRLDTRPETGIRYYSYEHAKKNPVAFARWWQFYLGQWNQMGRTIFARDPEGALPFRLKPGSEALLFQSRVSINSRGFRGREFRPEKGDAYRIVALGESTTFGCTMNAEDETWPALLEKMIETREKPSRPVEVINAGVPSYNLKHNLHRLERDILPLKPDMIISYHGYNGFELVDEALPPPYGNPPPEYAARPLKLLADCEYRFKMLAWRHGQVSRVNRNKPKFADPMKTAYAEAFRELISVCMTNNIRLVLSTFSMAANGRSDPDLVEFYRNPFFFVHRQIEANAVLSRIVKELVRSDPSLCLVDTQPALDGRDEQFIDLVHFTQPGREQMAELFFAGIRNVLREDLAGGAHRNSQAQYPIPGLVEKPGEVPK